MPYVNAKINEKETLEFKFSTILYILKKIYYILFK